MKSSYNYSKPINSHLIPGDPLYSQQWHFDLIGSIGRPKNGGSSVGVEAIWEDYRGQGIKVGIWDDGVQSHHPDLAINYNSQLQVSVEGTPNNGQPLTGEDGHGTSVAGLIGAAKNSSGVVGVSYESQLTGVRIFGGQDDINSNWERYLKTLDHLSQFDVTNHSYGGYPDFAVYGDVAKFAYASANGRDGLGTINVKSAGNSNIDGNGEGLDASRHTITVAATDINGQVTSYSTYGAHILVAAPAASVTTDLIGLGNGYDGLPDNNYTNNFGGTSAAGPVTAGVVALMLSANDQLGWRDVQNILVYSSTGAGSLYGGSTSNQNATWKWNDAADWNGGGLHYSEDYGYGIVNAYSAVRMAEVWSILYDASPLTSNNEAIVTTGNIIVNNPILDQKTLTYAFNVAQDISLEHVAMTINLTHSYFNDLKIKLISPTGTSYTLYDGSSGDGGTADFGLNYAFGIEGFRGEGSLGTWNLVIQDVARRDSGILNSINFMGYGSPQSNYDVYHYTEEIFDVITLNGQSSRINLSDLNGGLDWINLASVANDLDISLESGSASTLTGMTFLNIAQDGTLIENIAAGDGNDSIIANTADNVVFGGRGNDIMWGMAGNDTAIFRGQDADYVINFINGITSVTGLDGSDQLVGFEFIQFDNVLLNDPSGGVIPPDTSAPILMSSNPADNLVNVAINSNIVLTFDENIILGDGNIILTNGVGDVSLIAANDINQVTVNGKELTINPVENLNYKTNYYLTIGADAIGDESGNDFIINDPTTFNFSTESQLTIINGTNRGERLNGTNNDDLIRGLGGNDRINGFLGDDILDGGAGQDSIIFNTVLGINNSDILINFNTRDDTISLENAIFSNLTKTGTLNAVNFVSNAGGVAMDSNDYILYDSNSGHIFYDPDGNGNTSAMMFAQIDLDSVQGTLSQADFLII
jgi:subtilisin-like proprotein convertase family protein